jgi:hypothetical protein
MLFMQEETQSQCRTAFEENGSTVQLYKFLKPEIAEQLLQAITAADKADGLGYMEATEFTVGVRGGWRPVGPPHRHRYRLYNFVPLCICNRTNASEAILVEVYHKP